MIKNQDIVVSLDRLIDSTKGLSKIDLTYKNQDFSLDLDSETYDLIKLIGLKSSRSFDLTYTRQLDLCIGQDNYRIYLNSYLTKRLELYL